MLLCVSNAFAQETLMLSVGANGAARVDKPVEIQLERAPSSIIEIGANGEPAGEAIPFQVDRVYGDEGFDITFIMNGETPGDATRRYRVSFNESESKAASVGDPVSVESGIEHEDQESFKIETASATYYYHRLGAGFASIEDRDGADWLSYNPGVGAVSESGSGGMYRGLPNMGYPEGYNHPGKKVSDTTLIADGPIKASLLSESNDGKMKCRWDIFPRYARMTILEMRTPYWFLYEGTPGGVMDMQDGYCLRPGGLRTPLAEKWDGDLSAPGEPGEWAAFGQGDRALFLVNHHDDEGADSYWPMNEEMTVFGFGRLGMKKFLDRVPAQFTIGLFDSASDKTIAGAIHSAYMPLSIQIEAAR